MSGSAVIKLNNGVEMPLLGLGCGQSTPDAVAQAVETALDCGYRHIDTAYNYLNEEGVGKGINAWLKKTGNSRKDVFVVTKLPDIGMVPGGVKKFLKISLENLQLDYVDLYLVHDPVGFKEAHDKDLFPMDEEHKFIIDDSTDLIAIWKEMEEAADSGLAKTIGVSNFSTKQIRKVQANSRIPPAVHQVEMHLYFQQRQMQKFCKAKNIALTAYAALGSPGSKAERKESKNRPLLSNPIVGIIAEKHGVSTAQILIKFWIQEGISVIPKSVTTSRIKTNGDVYGFELSPLEMDALKYLDQGEKGRLFDFESLGMKAHPECPVAESDDE